MNTQPAERGTTPQPGTALPWEATDGAVWSGPYDPAVNTLIASVFSRVPSDNLGESAESKANARYIVHAANNFPAASELIRQLVKDLNEAHDELMKVQGCETPANYDWPEWTPQANSIRWAEELLGERLSKSALANAKAVSTWPVEPCIVPDEAPPLSEAQQWASGGSAASTLLALTCYKCGTPGNFLGATCRVDAFNAGWRLDMKRGQMCPKCAEADAQKKLGRLAKARGERS